MAYREFLDDAGRRWEVWEVRPSQASGRRSAMGAPSIAPGLEHGWLAFRRDDERRRVVPPPAGWERMSEENLRLLLRQAQKVSASRRLIE